MRLFFNAAAIIAYMKKNAVILLVIILFLVAASGCVRTITPSDGYLRIHIRASSNASCDQEIKLVVRDSLVKYLSPLLSEAQTRKEAEQIITGHIYEIEKATNELLYSCGYFYGCEVRVDTEYFERRRYENLVLEEGYYRAVIVNLGTGKGDNWWCVAFPPLCFTYDDYENVNYKSILAEVVKKYLDEEGE